MWLNHLSGLLAASVTVIHAIEKKGRPVLVHCSDGWDRTPQIVATAQLCLDPFYRTVEVGFFVLLFFCFVRMQFVFAGFQDSYRKGVASVWSQVCRQSWSWTRIR